MFFFVNILGGRGNLTSAWIKLKKKKGKAIGVCDAHTSV
jgi:hypothetical protein